MKNTLSDLNNYLFEQLEMLSDETLRGEALDEALKKSDTIIKIAKTVIENGHLAFSVKKHLDEFGPGGGQGMPIMLKVENK